MGKRVLLLLITNILVVLTLTVVLSVLGVGRYLGGADIGSLATFCFVWGMGGAFISLQISRFIAKRTTGAKTIDGQTGRQELDWLYQTVSRLTRQANLPMPEVAVYESPELNAFATGPSQSRALVAVSTGLLRSMQPDEIEGVLAHEITHIANGDMVTMTLLQGVINAFVMFLARLIAYFIVRGDGESRRSGYGAQYMLVMVLQIVLGILGSIVTAWFSREREFRADAGGASLAGRNQMIAALRRLKANQELVQQGQPALATLKIHDAPGWTSLFSTHPPLDVRIAALENLH